MATTPFPVAAKRLLRDTLLDAADGLLADRPWSAMTMAQVADAAGVSRQTLYKEFGTRAEFTQAYVLREGGRFLSEVEDAVVAHRDDAPRAVQAAFDVFLSAAAANPLIRGVLAGEEGSEELLALVTTRGRPVVEYATLRLAEVILATWPQVSRPDARRFTEALVRLAISHATLPAGPSGMEGHDVMVLLGPYVREILYR